MIEFVFCLTIGLAAAAGGYLTIRGLQGEPKRLIVERRFIPVPDLPPTLDGLTIALLTDFHLFPNGRGIELAEEAVLRANEANPDLVFLGGDLVHWSGAVPFLIPVLRQIRSRYGVFAVLGNHDHHCPWRWRRPAPWGGTPLSIPGWRDVFRKGGAFLLVNEAIPVSVGRTKIWVVGVDDAYTRRANLRVALRDVPEGAFVLLLSHSPDIVDDPLIDRIAVVFSGHTHGGQINLPLFGPLFAPCREKRRRAQGLTRVGKAWLYVSRGVSAGIPLRFRCPPEVTVLRLIATEDFSLHPAK